MHGPIRCIMKICKTCHYRHGGFDPIRDQGNEYAEASAVGNQVTHYCFGELTHSFYACAVSPMRPRRRAYNWPATWQRIWADSFPHLFSRL